MRLPRFFLLVIALPAALAACKKPAESDFGRLCDLTGRYLADRGADREAKRIQWAKELDAVSWRDPATMKSALGAVALTAPEAKYAHFKTAAKQAGLGEEWACPALEDWLDEAAVARKDAHTSGTL